MDTLTVQLLCAAELEVSKTFFKTFAHLDILQLLLDQITGVLDEVQSDL